MSQQISPPISPPTTQNPLLSINQSGQQQPVQMGSSPASQSQQERNQSSLSSNNQMGTQRQFFYRKLLTSLKKLLNIIKHCISGGFLRNSASTTTRPEPSTNYQPQTSPQQAPANASQPQTQIPQQAPTNSSQPQTQISQQTPSSNTQQRSSQVPSQVSELLELGSALIPLPVQILSGSRRGSSPPAPSGDNQQQPVSTQQPLSANTQSPQTSSNPQEQPPTQQSSSTTVQSPQISSNSLQQSSSEPQTPSPLTNQPLPSQSTKRAFQIAKTGFQSLKKFLKEKK